MARLSQNHSPPASILLRPFSLGVFGAEPRARHHRGPIPSQHARPSGVFAHLEDPNQLFLGSLGIRTGAKQTSRLVGNNPGTAAAPRVMGAS